AYRPQEVLVGTVTGDAADQFKRITQLVAKVVQEEQAAQRPLAMQVRAAQGKRMEYQAHSQPHSTPTSWTPGFLSLGLVLAAGGAADEKNPPKDPDTPSKPVSQWLALLAEDKDDTRLEAAVALVRLGKNAIPDLQKALEDPTVAVRVQAATALVRLCP